MRAKELRIARPCGENWDTFVGRGDVRTCQTCQRDVMDLSDWTEQQVDVLLSRPGERPCVRLRVTRAGAPVFAPPRPSRVAVAVPMLALAACTPLMGAPPRHGSRPQEPEPRTEQTATETTKPHENADENPATDVAQLLRAIPPLPKLKGVPSPAVVEAPPPATDDLLVYPDLELRHAMVMGKIAIRNEELEPVGGDSQPDLESTMVMGEMASETDGRKD